MTNTEINEVIQKVAKNHRDKAFGSYTPEDIEHEVWLIALNKIELFKPNKGKVVDEKKALERWLNVVISNRLKNLYRDEYVVPQRLHKDNKNNLLKPLDITSIGDRSDNIELIEIVQNKELWNYVLQNISDSEIEILDGLLSGELINSYYKNKIFIKIKELIKLYGSK